MTGPVPDSVALPASPPVLAPAPGLFILFNPGSGRHAAEQTRAEVEAACKTAGRTCEWFEIRRGRRIEDLAADAVRAASRAGGIAVAAGGDGTLNALAQAALPAGCAFGVLPRGTFNYFARTHGIPQESDQALAALLAGRPEPVQAGWVNQRVFLVNASLGLYARALEDRERAKARFGRSRLVAAAAALGTLMRGFGLWHLRVQRGDQKREFDTPTLFVGNNALQFERVGIREAEVVEDGALAAVAMDPIGRGAMFMLLVRAAFGRLGTDSRVQSFAAVSLEVRASGRRATSRVRVATDGELTWMDMPLRLQVAPWPLWLMAPPVEMRAERA